VTDGVPATLSSASTADTVGRRPRGRKAQIVSAAAELFATRGFAATGIDDIGAQVGISGPAIYRHFKSKDAILAAVIMETVTAFAVDGAGVSKGIGWLVANTVGVALDSPANLATYIRERHRLSGVAREQLARLERPLYRAWRRSVRAANPGLQDGAIATRQMAVLSAMSAVAIRPPLTRGPQLEALLVEAMMAVLQAPDGPASAATSNRGSWAPPPTRRHEILVQALGLFRERGFDGVGIDEIGAAVGISGPTVYFYYDTKAAILVDAYEQAGARVVTGIHESLGAAESAADALERLAASYLEVAHDNGDLIVVTSREGAAIPVSDRPRFARRRGDVLGTWVTVMRELRPELDDGAARVLAGGVMPLMNQLAQCPGDPNRFVPLVLAWCLGSHSC